MIRDPRIILGGGGGLDPCGSVIRGLPTTRSHQLGVAESNMYETWYEGYMQLIRRWLVNPIEFFPQFPSLSNLHKQWVTLFIECLHSVFQKHKLCIRAPTRINPTDRFGETMFGYTCMRLQQQKRIPGFLMEACIRSQPNPVLT